MSGLSYFVALGVRGVDRKPLIIAGEVSDSLVDRQITCWKDHF